MMPPTVEVCVYFLVDCVVTSDCWFVHVFPRLLSTYQCSSHCYFIIIIIINEVLVSDAADHITGILIHISHDFEQHSACGMCTSWRVYTERSNANMDVKRVASFQSALHTTDVMTNHFFLFSQKNCFALRVAIDCCPITTEMDDIFLEL